MSLKKLVLTACAAVALVGAANAQSYRCADRGDQALSTIAGAVIGGVIGGQFGNDGDDRAIGAVAGALLGGAAGASVGQRGCDEQGYYQPGYDQGYYNTSGYGPGYDGAYDTDDSYYDDAFETAAPYQQVRWDDPRTGRYGYVQPADWYQDEYGNDCREFEQEIYIDGRRQVATGTACREPDGSWRIVD